MKRPLEIYADGADLTRMAEVAPLVQGWTTNPSLMRAAGITNYLSFAQQVMTLSQFKPISFEVLSEEPDTMVRQAQTLAALGPNVLVKIPIIQSDGRSNATVIAILSQMGIRVNVTACFTKNHIRTAIPMLWPQGGIISIFAGRIADTGIDPAKLFSYARHMIRERAGDQIKTLWASTREPLNILHARRAGADIITVAPEMFKKALVLRYKDLDQYARETVQQFSKDAEGITL